MLETPVDWIPAIVGVNTMKRKGRVKRAFLEAQYNMRNRTINACGSSIVLLGMLYWRSRRRWAAIQMPCLPMACKGLLAQSHQLCIGACTTSRRLAQSPPAWLQSHKPHRRQSLTGSFGCSIGVWMSISLWQVRDGALADGVTQSQSRLG